MVEQSWSIKDWSVSEKNQPFVVPSFETISFSLPSVDSWEELIKGKEPGWVYLSEGNPTLAALEKVLARAQGVESCWVTSTGKSAIASILLALLKQGDHVLILREGYKSTRLFIQTVLQRFGVSDTLVPVDDLNNLEKYIQKNTKLLILEAPTNPMTRVPDFAKCAKIAEENNIITLLDSSLSAFQTEKLPVDLIVHSLSKYASGNGDVMGGAILGSKEWIKKLQASNYWNADALSTHNAVELWKGMQTYTLRRERQASTTLKLAQYLETHPQVSRVSYPGLPSHPDHHIAKKQMKDFGCILAFDVRGDAKKMKDALNRLRLFRLAFGTGFIQSLASPAWLFYARSFPEAQTGPWDIYDTTVRLSIGVEPVEDLIADLNQALA
jgi:methionine-gamma-lyase